MTGLVQPLQYSGGVALQRTMVRALPGFSVDDDGIGDQPLPMRATVTISGDSVAVDFTGTSLQVRTNLNAPFASTVSAAISA